MTKQPIKVRDHLLSLKNGGLILPEQKDPRQLWLLVVLHPIDGHKGEVFITHAQNFSKFDNRPGFEIIAHSYDRDEIRNAQRRLTLRLGEAYQPKFSAHTQPLGAPDSPDTAEDFSPKPEQPEDLLDFIGQDGPLTKNGD